MEVFGSDDKDDETELSHPELHLFALGLKKDSFFSDLEKPQSESNQKLNFNVRNKTITNQQLPSTHHNNNAQPRTYF